jgi:hypothetical protein
MTMDWRTIAPVVLASGSLAGWVHAMPVGPGGHSSGQVPVVPAVPKPAVAPDAEGALGLYSDLARVVQAEEAAGWILDQHEYEQLLPDLLDAVCRASPVAREETMRRVRYERDQVPDPRQLFARDGELTSDVEDALTLWRRDEALRLALARIDRCPFWVVPQYGFLGRQSDRHRFTLGVESGGNLQFRQTSGSWTFGGGGLGRILPAYGFGEHWTGLWGIEFGGGAMLKPGGPQTEFVVNYFPAMPMVLRYRDVDWHYDIEVGPVGIFQADNTSWSYGARIGGAIGVFSLRTLSVLPWAGLAMTYEYYFENAARPAAHFIRGGLRVGIVWDP